MFYELNFTSVVRRLPVCDSTTAHTHTHPSVSEASRKWALAGLSKPSVDMSEHCHPRTWDRDTVASIVRLGAGRCDVGTPVDARHWL